MSEKVFILATVRSDKLMGATRLVFATLRTGFPNAEIIVHGNNLHLSQERELAALCQATGCQFQRLDRYWAHDEWIESLARELWTPFWICDTDMVFFKKVEHWKFNAPIAGEYQPTWFCNYTHCWHLERLHTALMRIEPEPLRAASRQWFGNVRLAPFVPEMQFVRQHFSPMRNEDGSSTLWFYDSCAGLYHAIGGAPFTEKQLDAFEHLHCATYIDLVAPVTPSPEKLLAAHEEICRNPAAARGIRAQQREFFKKHALNPKGK